MDAKNRERTNATIWRAIHNWYSKSSKSEMVELFMEDGGRKNRLAGVYARNSRKKLNIKIA